MEEQKVPAGVRHVQATLDHFVSHNYADSEYGHLVQHLFEQEEHPDKNSYWTRVFSRDTEEGLQISIHQIGPDLIYDRSVREALSQQADLKGEILFSPFMFTAEQMVTDLAQKKLSLNELMELGK